MGLEYVADAALLRHAYVQVSMDSPRRVDGRWPLLLPFDLLTTLLE